MAIFTKLGVDIFDPTDASGNDRGPVMDEMQTWTTEVERSIVSFNADQATISTDITIGDSHHRKTLYIATTGIDIAFPDASTLANDDHVTFIVNANTDPVGIRITSSASDFTAWTLYSGQAAAFYSDGTTFRFIHPGRWKPGSQVRVWVNSSTGSNNNDGLAAARPVATLNRGAQIIYHDCDHGGVLPALECTGTFTEGLSLSAYGQLTGVSTMYIRGYNNTKFTWKPTGGVCFQFGDNSIAILSYIKFDNAGGTSGQYAIIGHQTGILDLWQEIEFGEFIDGAHINVDTDSKINISYNYAISGSSFYHTNQAGGSQIHIAAGITITVTNTPDFDIYHRLYGAGNAVRYGAGVTWSGAFTAGIKQWEIVGLSELRKGGATIPGSVTGTESNGGQAY